MNQRFLIGALIVAAAAALFFASVSQAQYPPPSGNVTGTTEETTPETDSETEIACEVRDEAGNPVEDAECTFTIESQPGDDAEFVTDTAIGSGLKTLRPARASLAEPVSALGSRVLDGLGVKAGNDGGAQTVSLLTATSITKYTDANGVASVILNTGSTPGTIVISITSGDKESTVLVDVGGALPPAGPVLQPPSTGDAGLICSSC